MDEGKKNNKIILVAIIAFFSFYSTAYSIDKKEEMLQYLDKVNPVLVNVQITSRNLSQRLIPLTAVIEQMDSYIDTMNSLRPPEFMIKQHKMILLSFKKLKMGFYLLSLDDKETSVRLVRGGRDLLRMGVKDILELGKKEGIIKEDVEREE